MMSGIQSGKLTADKSDGASPQEEKERVADLGRGGHIYYDVSTDLRRDRIRAMVPSFRVVVIEAGHGTTRGTIGDGRVGGKVSGDRRDWTERGFLGRDETAVIRRIAAPSELQETTNARNIFRSGDIIVE